MIILCSFLSLLLLVILYYIKIYKTFNKLKNVSGPMPWPLVGNVLSFLDKYKYITNGQYFMLKYGKIVRGAVLADPYLVVADADLMGVIMNSSKFNEKECRYSFLHNWLGTGLLTSKGEKWFSRRKLLTPAFHFNILKTYVPILNKTGDTLVEKMKKKTDTGYFNIVPLISLCSLDAICETSLGKKVNAMDNSDSIYVRSINRLVELITARAPNPLKQFNWMYKLSPSYWEESKLIKQLHETTYGIIRERKKYFEKIIPEGEQLLSKNKLRSFLDILIQSQEKHVLETDEDIREEVDTFIFEGYDTTSICLSFTLYLVATHPDVQNKILSELRDLEFDRETEATHENLQKMSYLEMVIKESLRLFPPVAAMGRYLREDVQCEIGTIAANTGLILIPMFMHRLEEYFPDPEDFIPERFAPENLHKIKPFSYIPFSGGYRNCIGQKFAMMELKAILAKLVVNFKFICEPGFVPDLCIQVLLSSGNGIRLSVEERD